MTSRNPFPGMTLKELGLALHAWHSSGRDPIYALGSTLYSRALVLADSAASASIVRGAVVNLRKSAREYRADAETWRGVSNADADECAASAREARLLADELERRFAALLEKYPEHEEN